MNSTEILRKYKSFAVIGVTTNTEKYGYKVYQKLKELNKIVYGISPIYSDIDGDPTYPSLESVGKPIDIAVFIVNKKFGLSYLEEVQDLGIKYAWMQPGTYDEDFLGIIKDKGITPIPDCVLIQADYL